MIPPFITIRERSMQNFVIKQLEIGEENKQEYKASLKNLKDIWRWCSYSKLEEALGVNYGYAVCNGLNECSGYIKCIPTLAIDILFHHPVNEEECKIM